MKTKELREILAALPDEYDVAIAETGSIFSFPVILHDVHDKTVTLVGGCTESATDLDPEVEAERLKDAEYLRGENWRHPQPRIGEVVSIKKPPPY